MEAEGLLNHLEELKEDFKTVEDIVVSMEAVLVGPKSELDKLREPLNHMDVKFFENFVGAMKTFK